MVRYLVDVERRRGIFLCDDCGRPLYRNDKGVVYFPHNEKFFENVEQGRGIHTKISFVCMDCFDRMKKKKGEKEGG
ncbi:hypothetical protein D6833_13165 [Candidatus Parcubacteria bacterium]|nr:MAG: hypothetical protein D6833_13165 [Candidatus Parcubacteria bacterium]